MYKLVLALFALFALLAPAAAGYIPPPPARPSSTPPQTVNGRLEIRDLTGRVRLGYIENALSRTPILGLTPASSPRASDLAAAFDPRAHTLLATNARFAAPYFLGSSFPYANDPGAAVPEEILFTNVPESAGAEVWSFDAFTRELTIHLPNPHGGSVQPVFALDTYQNALELVTDVPVFLAATRASEPPDKQPVLVRIYLVD
ncbi:hypothetical protein BC834DRAFT_632908 [Gloeopeniophorella convolvens]|nr:hypothetical protein BC834DRAFT_632908 [Gloeopeniophorella convolvens]